MSDLGDTRDPGDPGDPGAGEGPVRVSGVEIVLDEVTKLFPGQRSPAVDRLSLTVPAGEIVMLIGPSGCGKTTSLKMVNRLIEPTSGSIRIDGQDVRTRGDDDLRRHIGYVIQGGSLFPHMTVGKNIGIVPRLLGWDADRVRARTAELLDLVGLDPGRYLDRYPRELSGGQQQRVGVARGLAADPPVLLMDEPFGAVDPITRQRLQDELLAIQHELGKTIVCVTHDIDEAIKLGDRIAILRERAQVAQYDTPANVLSAPADDFVRDFVGSGSTLKQLSLTRVDAIRIEDWTVAHVGDDVAAAIARAEGAGHDSVVVLDTRSRRPVGWPWLRQLRGHTRVPAFDPEEVPSVHTSATLNDALDTMLTASHAAAVVTGERGQFLGVINFGDVTDHLRGINPGSAGG